MQANPKPSADQLFRAVTVQKSDYEPLYAKLNLSLQKIKLKEREKNFRKDLESLSKEQIIESIASSLSENPSIFCSMKNAIKNLPKLDNEAKLSKQISSENLAKVANQEYPNIILTRKDSFSNHPHALEHHKCKNTELKTKLQT